MTRLLLPLTLCACAASPVVPGQPRDVSFTPLAKSVWLYEVRTNSEHEVVPANGLIIDTAQGPVLVDTGWREDQAEQLVAFIEQTLGRPPVLAVVTHSHLDRNGGAAVLTRRGIRIATTDERFGDDVELFFPGAGHARDNIVVWHAPTKTLYGGCFIKAAEQGIGWIKDADLAAWPRSLEATAKRFPDAVIVVPGHGKPGGPELLTHTAALIAAQ